MLKQTVILLSLLLIVSGCQLSAANPNEQKPPPFRSTFSVATTSVNSATSGFDERVSALETRLDTLEATSATLLETLERFHETTPELSLLGGLVGHAPGRVVQ